MSQQRFAIRPVAHYSGARYPGVAPRRPPVDDDADGRKPGPLRLALTAALILFISLGLVACFGDLRGKLNDRFEVIVGADAGGGDGGSGDDGGDITMGVMVECSPGDVRCDDADTLVTCDDSYTPQTQSCATVCEERYAASGSWGHSLGCDASAADPCQCQEDIIDGGMPACYPGDVYCADSATLVECGDDYSVNTIDCEAACDEQYGDPMAYSLGCDAAAADPCQCQYDIVMGVAPVCMPGDVACEDGNVLVSCDENYNQTRQDCDETCAAQGQISLGCDAAAEDPCQCEYDIVMGEMTVCTPGDIICLDAATAGVCDDGVDYAPVPCEAHCQQTLGEDYTSIGCDAQDPNNFCGCKPRQG